MKNPTEPNALVYRLMLAVFLAVPINYAIFLLGMHMAIPYLLLHNLLGYDWTAYGSSRIDIRRFLEFWHVGFGIHAVYMAVYAIIAKRKVKLKIELLIAMAIGAAVFIHMGDLDRPSRGFVLSNLGYIMAYAFLFAAIMFSVFILLVVILDIATKWKESIKITLSFVLSSTLGGILSYFVWIALFRHFHESAPLGG